MIRLFFVFLFMLSLCSSFTQDYLQERSIYDHLSTVNKEWINYSSILPEEKIRFNSDEQRIQLHLKLVCQYLRDNIPIGLDKNQFKNRNRLITELEDYAKAGAFPINLYHTHRQPYFVDDFGTHCAVGYLMHTSGNDELVARIKSEHNYDYIKDIHTNGVLGWAQEQGFTLEELKWIQPTYMPTNVIEPLDEGTNGVVHSMVYNHAEGATIIAGEFSQANNMPCLNLAKYQNDQLSCFGNGLEGIVEQLSMSHQDLYVFGKIEENNSSYPIARYSDSTWSFLEIPMRPDAHASAGLVKGVGSSVEIYVSIYTDSLSQEQEIWYYNIQTDNWTKLANVYGEVFDITSYFSKIVFGGKISAMTDQTGNTVPVLNSVNNVILFDNYDGLWQTINGPLPDTVYTFQGVGNTLFIGGSAQNGQPCLSSYMNNYVQPVLYYSNLAYNDSRVAINDIAYDYTSDDIVIGGEFIITPFVVGYHGQNLARYNLVQNNVSTIALLDKEVRCLTYTTVGANANLYLGGAFTNNLSAIQLNHVGRITQTSSLSSAEKKTAISVYPNPFTEAISIDGLNGVTNYTIYNSAGKIVKSGEISGKEISNLKDLKNGVYILHLTEGEDTYVQRIVK